MNKQRILIVSKQFFEHGSFLPMGEKLKEAEIQYTTDHLFYDDQQFKTFNPDKIFFIYWSYIIPERIFNHFECIVFHMTDLPFGRGGSPLQNLISRGIYETKISALRCVKELDAGDIYLKKPLTLHGSAQEIYIQAQEIIAEMIIQIICECPVPVPQQGEVVCFSRRKPNESDISQLQNLVNIFDYIRMLDADNYPKAFIEIGNFKYEFSGASYQGDTIIANVEIREIQNGKGDGNCGSPG